MGFVYIVATVLLVVYGQLIIKWKVVEAGQPPEALIGKLYFFLKLIVDPFVLSGFCAALLGSLCWMAAMTKFELSQAYPIVVGLMAVLTSVFAVILFKEAVGFYKMVGLFFLVVGLFFLSRG